MFEETFLIIPVQCRIPMTQVDAPASYQLVTKLLRLRENLEQTTIMSLMLNFF